MSQVRVILGPRLRSIITDLMLVTNLHFYVYPHERLDLNMAV